MKYKIYRAYEEHSLEVIRGYPELLSIGIPFTVEEDRLILDITTLDQLNLLKETVGYELIIGSDTITIYDDYIE